MPYPGGTKGVGGPIGVGGPTGAGGTGAGAPRRKYVPLSLFFLQQDQDGEEEDQLYGKKKKGKDGKGDKDKDGQQNKNKNPNAKAADQTKGGKGDKADAIGKDAGGSRGGRSGPGVKPPLGTVPAGGGRQEWIDGDEWTQKMMVERKIGQPQKCKLCEAPATKGVIWADGRAYVPSCDKHLAKWKKKLADVVAIRDIPQRHSSAATEAGERLTPTPEEEKAFKSFSWKKMPSPPGKPFETVGYTLQTPMGKTTVTKKKKGRGFSWILKVGKTEIDLGRKADFDHAEGELLRLYRQKNEGAGFGSFGPSHGLGAARLGPIKTGMSRLGSGGGATGVMGTGNVATVPVPLGLPIRRVTPSGRRKKKKSKKQRKEWMDRLAAMAK